ncbi:unnamed protein product [Caenorhabditis angaria]|uniref:Uncharacterized protein n=1 Tax=Caenorhabditis angaria TaxID=860376 RepID=A0A9P1N001_9PELO|nr:unnamed protein product [Caenorhabditis angaria]
MLRTLTSNSNKYVEDIYALFVSNNSVVSIGQCYILFSNPKLAHLKTQDGQHINQQFKEIEQNLLINQQSEVIEQQFKVIDQNLLSDLLPIYHGYFAVRNFIIAFDS